MIELKNVTKTYKGPGGLWGSADVKALRGVSLQLADGAAVALIGESGCGKTTLGRIMTGLETLDTGELYIEGTRVTGMRAKTARPYFQKIQLIHQDPYSAINPSRSIGSALLDPLRLQARRTGRDARWTHDRAKELLRLVGLPDEETLYKYPHQLSGGQRQRLVIARALTVEPKALVADEAVSMIDVSLRLGILTLLSRLRRELGIAIIFITHDVAAARYVAQDGHVAVLYKGEVVEFGRTDEVIAAPVHPYTQALLSAVPVLRGIETPGLERFIVKTDAQMQATVESGCLFAPRCPFATERCAGDHPVLEASEENRLTACHYPQSRQVVATPLADRMMS